MMAPRTPGAPTWLALGVVSHLAVRALQIAEPNYLALAKVEPLEARDR